MLSLTASDKEIIDKSYAAFLKNLYNYLKNSEASCGVDYSKEIINLLHRGVFSMDGVITCTNDYDYLHLPNLCSDGALVMYGVCCCRHATSLFYDILKSLGFDVSLQYIKVCDDDNWKRVTYDKANHIIAILRENGKTYYLDAINKFILELLDNGDFKQLNIDIVEDFDYQDSNVKKIGEKLSKYYNLKRLGVEHIYEEEYHY